MFTEFLVALQFLTIVRLREALPFNEGTLGRSGAFFPMIGFLLGLTVWGLDILFSFLVPLSLANVLLIVTLAGLSRGLHLDGLADSADGLLGSTDRQRSLAIMKDSCIGTFGALALIGIVVLKLRALDLLSGVDRTHALLLSPMLSRWACVVMAYAAPPAREDGLGALFVRGVQFREVMLASVFVLVAGLLIVGFPNLLLLGLFTGIAWGATRYCERRLGGITGDTMGAVGEIIETATFCFFAS
ncbi:MAG: adenosylcobinamide-GDP ribazoletransferase [Candidatus Binatia bacterium]